jgi:amidase
LTEIWQLGAAELAVLIRGRKLSCRQVIDAHLKRIDSKNGYLDAVTVTLPEDARNAADAIDKALHSGGAAGSLCETRP